MNGTDRNEPTGTIPPRALPGIRRVDTARIPYTPTAFKYVRSEHADVREVLAFRVTLDGELRLDTAETPVLWVGEVWVGDVERIGDVLYLFRAFPEEENRMAKRAPIALGWPGTTRDPTARTRFRFMPPGQ